MNDDGETSNEASGLTPGTPSDILEARPGQRPGTQSMPEIGQECGFPKQSDIRKSSGPRTKIDRRRSSRNAIKHGIFSDVVVLPGEPREKYQSLLEGLREARRPEGRLEDLLVEELAAIAWRKRRLLIAEGAEIRVGSEFWEWDEQNRQRQEAEAKRSGALEPKYVLHSDPSLIGKILDPEMLAACLNLLTDLRQDIESGGFDEERDTAVLEKIYGPIVPFRNSLLQTYRVWFNTAEVCEEDRNREGYATPQKCKDYVLAEIVNEIRRLRKYQRKCKSVESERGELEVLRRLVPDSARLDRLVRYGASLDRAFDRILGQLDREQRLRKDQP